MFFTFKDITENKERTKLYLLATAKKRVALYPFGAAEISLDKYLQENYKLGLRAMCMYLVQKIDINSAGDNEITITFKDKELDNIAALITYGNELVSRSNILRFAFKDFGKELKYGS